jgi:hypothetical protein
MTQSNSLMLLIQGLLCAPLVIVVEPERLVVTARNLAATVPPSI